MPKMKTHRGAKKRFRVTAKGRFKRDHAYTSHIFSGKSRKVKRHHRQSTVVATTELHRLKRLLPYG